MDSSVARSASHAGDLGLNPSGGLTRVNQSMNERKRLSSVKSQIASVSFTGWCIIFFSPKIINNN